MSLSLLCGIDDKWPDVLVRWRLEANNKMTLENTIDLMFNLLLLAP